MRKITVLLHTKDNPFHVQSGYGKWGKYVFEGLATEGFDIAAYAPVGTNFGVETIDGKEVYPGNVPGFGEELVGPHLETLGKKTNKKPVLLQICDIWPLNIIPKLAREKQIDWITTPAVDWIGPTPKYVAEKLQSARIVVPWTRFAERKLKDEGFSNINKYIPLGVNTEIFKPLNPDEHEKMAKGLFFERDSFNITIIAANQWQRKPFWENFTAIKQFILKNPGVKTNVYVHTLVNVAGSFNIDDLLEYCGINNVTTVPNPYDILTGKYTEELMSEIIGLSDVVLNTGHEGFGLPTIEAQACGVPVIALDNSPSKELVKNGLLVPSKGKRCGTNLLVQDLPDENKIEEALEMIYYTGNPNKEKGVEFVRKNFNWERIVKKWVRLLDKLETEMDELCEFKPEPSERLRKMEVK